MARSLVASNAFLAFWHAFDASTPPQLFLDSSEMDKLPEANHRLLHIKATPSTFAFDGVQFASPYVEDGLKLRLLKFDLQQVSY